MSNQHKAEFKENQRSHNKQIIAKIQIFKQVSN